MVKIGDILPQLEPGKLNVFQGRLNNSGGVAQGCQYICNIFPPRSWLTQIVTSPSAAALGLISTVAAGQVSLMAESCSIPGRQLLTTQHKIQGTLRQMPYGILYENMTITFICTNFMVERTFFDMWHQYIISPASQYMEYYENYIGQIVIQKTSNDTEIDPALGSGSGNILAAQVSTYVLEEAYPVSIQAQELSYDDNGYLRLSVEFAYARWRNTIDRFMPSGIPVAG